MDYERAPRKYLTPVSRRKPKETTEASQLPTLAQEDFKPFKETPKTAGPRILPRIEYIGVLSPEAIQIDVGESATTFWIHDDMIKNSSDFFRAAINGKFKEACERIICLPELEVDVFKSYVHWLYTGKVVLEADQEAWKDENAQLRYVGLSKLYVAGDMLGSRRLRNAVIDRIGDLAVSTQHIPWGESVCIAYENTPEGSALRKLYMCYYATILFRESVHGETLEWFLHHVHEYPKTFNNDAMNDLFNWSSANPLAVDPTYTFHEHDDHVSQHASELYKERMAAAVGRKL